MTSVVRSRLKGVMPQSLASWEIIIIIDGQRFMWRGGPYIDILDDDGNALDCVNVWDYQKGKSQIQTISQLISRIRSYILAIQGGIDER